MTLALMALAGGLGALARVEVGVALRRRGAQRWATRGVNVLGTGLLALLLTLGASDPTIQIVGTGLLGGFTTFSNWMAEASAQRGRARVVEVALPLVAAAAIAALITSLR